VNEFPLSPFVDGTVQMLRPASGMKTLVGDGEDALLCEFKDGDRTVWILSDPDVMANHGLWRGQNADFMVRVIKSRSEEGNDGYRGRRAIIFDETLHGYRASADSIIRMMLSFPYAIVTILACVSALLLAASAAGRFGAPAEARPALDFGKALLIDNSARLLDYGGHHSVTLARYVRMTLSDAARAMHAPDGMSERELAEWADRVGNARKASVSCASIFRTVDDAGRRGTDALTTAARMAHKWKGEILNGYSVRSERHRHDKK
jgi:hypothetical protein